MGTRLLHYRFVALALLLSFPVIDARAQSPAADLPVVPAPDFLVEVLTTTANTSQRLAATLPERLRDKF